MARRDSKGKDKKKRKEREEEKVKSTHEDDDNKLGGSGSGTPLVEDDCLDTFALHVAERSESELGGGKKNCKETDEDEEANEATPKKPSKASKSYQLNCVSDASVVGQVRVLSDKPDVGLACRKTHQDKCVFTHLNRYSIKERLLRHWSTLHKGKDKGSKSSAMDNNNNNNNNPHFADVQQAAFFTAMHQYKNVLHLQREAPRSGSGKGDRCMDAVLLHCVNHAMKTSDLVKKGNNQARSSSSRNKNSNPGSSKEGKKKQNPNKKFKKEEETEEKKTKDKTEEKEKEDFDPQRDQGFTRPKVLVLFPFRKFACNFIQRLMQMVMLPHFGTKHFKSISGGVQFLDEYSSPEQEMDMPSDVRKGLNKPMQNKPQDFRDLFEGNSDDHFRMGIKLTKSSVKLFSDFYKSDMIVASPLGLVTLINDAERSSDKSYDFLSSIEILVVDFADVLMMQNWEHVLTVMKHLNQIPAENHDTDIMRIREWYLAGNADKYLQTIVLSSYATAELNAFMSSRANLEGLVKFPERKEAKGIMSRVVAPVKQLYIKSKATSVQDENDSKMTHFQEEVLNKVLESFSPGILIFVRSYFDFVRLRKKLDDENVDFAALSEYTERSEADRTRTLFANGKKRILLYSERAHFYFRYRFKGIRDIIFYSLPDHANFYSELLNMIDTSSIQQPTATISFSKYDSIQLSRIVGLSQAKKMLASNTDTFMIA